MRIKYITASGTQATGYVTECLQICTGVFSISNDKIGSSYYNATNFNNYIADNKTSALVNAYQTNTSGTQATAFINECLQVSKNNNICSGNLYIRPPALYNKHISTNSFKHVLLNTKSQSVYFFGRKKDPKSDHGKTETKKSCTSSTCVSNKSTSQTKLKSSLSSMSNVKAKEVLIKVDAPCPAAVATLKNANLVATVSHIKIGPRLLCPVFGEEPCIGPKCLAITERQGPVTVTTAPNPRRGVFELVVRRLTGAPLATNELLLEWHPPQKLLQNSTYPSHKSCYLPIMTRPFKRRCFKKRSKKLSHLIPCRTVSCKMSCCKSFYCGKSKQNPPSPSVRSLTKSSSCNVKCKRKRYLRPCPVICKFSRFK